MTTSSRALAAVALCALGLYGLSHHVEFSGWALFAGVMVALNI